MITPSEFDQPLIDESSAPNLESELIRATETVGVEALTKLVESDTEADYLSDENIAAIEVILNEFSKPSTNKLSKDFDELPRGYGTLPSDTPEANVSDPDEFRSVASSPPKLGSTPAEEHPGGRIGPGSQWVMQSFREIFPKKHGRLSAADSEFDRRLIRFTVETDEMANSLQFQIYHTLFSNGRATEEGLVKLIAFSATTPPEQVRNEFLRIAGPNGRMPKETVDQIDKSQPVTLFNSAEFDGGVVFKGEEEWRPLGIVDGESGPLLIYYSSDSLVQISRTQEG